MSTNALSFDNREAQRSCDNNKNYSYDGIYNVTVSLATNFYDENSYTLGRSSKRANSHILLAVPVLNTEYRNQRRTNVHAHLPIVFDCRDVIIKCGQKLPTSRTIV